MNKSTSLLRRHRFLVRLLALSAAVVVLTTACGSGDGTVQVGSQSNSESATTTSTTPAGPEIAKSTTTAVAPPEVGRGFDAAALTQAHPCGFGFAASDTDQRVGLIISSETGFGGDEPVVDSPVNLPNDDWSATIRTGSDLFANWCDDVITPDEPTPVVDQRWQLVRGTLTITTGTDSVPCDGSPAGGLLEGAVAESPTGERVSLDTIELTNSAWGCFAG